LCFPNLNPLDHPISSGLSDGLFSGLDVLLPDFFGLFGLGLLLSLPLVLIIVLDVVHLGLRLITLIGLLDIFLGLD